MKIETHPDLSGYAPKSEAWHAFDADVYDGPRDGAPWPVGYGENPAEAILDLVEIMLDDGQLTRDEAEALLWLHSINPCRLVEA